MNILTIRLSLFVLALYCGLVFGCSLDKSPTLPAQITPIKTKQNIARLIYQKGKILASSPKNGTIEIYSQLNQTLLESVAIEGEPDRLIKDEINQCLYCLHTKENAISILSLEPLKIKKKIHTGDQLSLAGGAIRPNTNQLWICDGVAGVWILTTPDLRLIKKFEVGRYPENILFTPEGKKAYISLKGENAVAMIDPEKKTVVSKIKVGIYPRQLSWADEILCVSNFGSKNVALIETKTNTEKIRIKVRKKPNAMAIVQDTLWVACEDSYRIAAISLFQNKLIGTVKVNCYPGDILALPNGQLAISALKGNEILLVTPQLKNQ
jgi:YVTN family beta-propeller protein